MNLKCKISYWNDLLPYQDMARVDSSRSSITRSYGSWAKPHPFLPKEFPLLVCSREETHSRLLNSSNRSERPQGTGTYWKKHCGTWPCGAGKILFPAPWKILLLCTWRKTTVCLNPAHLTCQLPGVETGLVVSVLLTFIPVTYLM